MFGKLIVVAALVAAGYWYWNGPYQAGGSQGDDLIVPEHGARVERVQVEGALLVAATPQAAGGVVLPAQLLVESFDARRGRRARSV